jgi:hypothetical protein
MFATTQKPNELILSTIRAHLSAKLADCDRLEGEIAELRAYLDQNEPDEPVVAAGNHLLRRFPLRTAWNRSKRTRTIAHGSLRRLKVSAINTGSARSRRSIF